MTGYLDPEVWRIPSFGGHNHYHRSLTFYFDTLQRNGFLVARLHEPPHLSGGSGRPDAFVRSIPVFLLLESVAASGAARRAG